MLKRQRYRILLYLVLVSFPFGLMVLVNEFSPSPTFEQKVESCTRYCHHHACPHTLKKHGTESLSGAPGKVYRANITWLKNNPLGISYAEMNLAVYVLGLPGIMALLLWGVIRKGKGESDG